MLRGLRVLELASVLAGPSVGQFFAEMGASVIKVEPLGGDVTRRWLCKGEGEDVARDGRSAYFNSVNAGKRSIALDLRRDPSRNALSRLLDTSDVVLASYRPGSAAKLGVDAESCLRGRPRLIYGEITGYGEGDATPAYDAVLQAECGFTFMNGEPEGPPTKMPVALIDLLAGHQLKEGILLRLLRREREGEGGRVSVSLAQAAVSSLANQATRFLQVGEVPRRSGSAHPSIAPYGTVYACADGGSVVVACGSDTHFAELVSALGAAPLATDPRFLTNPQRVRNRDALELRLRALFAAASSDSVVSALRARGVPVGQVRTLDSLFGSQPWAQSVALHWPRTTSPSDLAGLRQAVFTTPGAEECTERALTPPPRLGEHTREILAEAGLDESAINAVMQPCD